MVNQASTEQELQQHSVASAASREEVTALLRQSGLDAAADRLDYLQELIEEDPDEPEMSLDSLRQLALFLMEERQLPFPGIGMGPDGLLGISWRIPERGIIAMRFLPSCLVQFAASRDLTAPESQRIGVNGTLPAKEALQSVKTFTSRIKTQ